MGSGLKEDCMKGPSVPVWRGVCTVVPAYNSVRVGASRLKALWDYRPISLFHALLTILFPSSMLPTLFFHDLLKNTKQARNMFTYEVVQHCALHCGHSPFNNAFLLVYLYCIGFRIPYRLQKYFRGYYKSVYDSFITLRLFRNINIYTCSPQWWFLVFFPC